MPNVEMLAIEIRSAIPVEEKTLDQFVDHPKLARSAAMLTRLVTWAPAASTPTIWKVGESHIDDILLLTGSQPVPKVKIFHRDAYLAAFEEMLKEKQIQDARRFYAAKPGDPLAEYVVNMGWVKLIPARSGSSTRF